MVTHGDSSFQALKPVVRKRSATPDRLVVSLRYGCFAKYLTAPMQPTGEVAVPPIFHLPTELFAMVASYISDKDLYNLTRVSYRMASIACPLYFAKKRLLFSLHASTLELHGEGFKALDIWGRYPQPSPPKWLICCFSFDSALAATQKTDLHRWFDSLPAHSHISFRSVRLAHVVVQHLPELLDFVRATVGATGCTQLTLSGVSYTLIREGKRKSAPKSIADTPVFEKLQSLRLTRFLLSPVQWGGFLSRLHAPALHALEIWNKSSMVAIFDFLSRHFEIRTIQFFKCHWSDASSSSHELRLPYLHTLHGYLYQTLLILGSLSLPPFMREIVIEASPKDSRQGRFFDQVVRCLAMCDGSPTLQVLLPKETKLSPMTIAGARKRAARKLRSGELPLVTSLRIGFVCMDDMIPVNRHICI